MASHKMYVIAATYIMYCGTTVHSAEYFWVIVKWTWECVGRLPLYESVSPCPEHVLRTLDTTPLCWFSAHLLTWTYGQYRPLDAIPSRISPRSHLKSGHSGFVRTHVEIQQYQKVL